MNFKTIKFDIKTDGSGDYSEVRKNPSGLLYKVVWTQGDLAVTTDLTITNRHGTVMFTQANITADFEKYPRILEALNSDGSALTTHDVPLIDAPVTVTVAQGGATANGTLELFII